MRSEILAEEGAKPKKGMAETASRWFGLLGVIAAAAALVLVPVSLDPDAVLSNPGTAYYPAELRTLLVAAAVLLVATTGMLVFDRRPLRFPVLIPALAVLGVSALSTLFSDRPAHSLYGDRGEGLLSVAAGVLLFYALAQGLTSHARLRLLLAAATTTAALVSLYGIAENYGFEFVSGWGNPPFTDLGRSSATVGNALTLAAYLTLMMGVATALWLGASTRLRKALWLLALALIGACWIYAETRGAILGSALALPLVLLAARRRMGTVRPLVVPIVVLVVAVAAAVAASMATGFSTLSLRVCAILLAYLLLVGAFFWLLERGKARVALFSLLAVLVVAGVATSAAAYSGKLTLADLGATRAAPSVNKYGDLSLQARLYIWRDAAAMVRDRPLLGYGTDNFRKPSRAHMSAELKDLLRGGDGRVPGLDRAHNHTLQLAATTGLLGLAAYLWLLVSYFRNAYRRGGWAILTLAGAVLAYVLQLQTAFPSVATDVAFWGVLGVSVALMRMRDPDHEGRAEGGAGPVYPEGRDEPAATVAGSRRSRRLGKKGSGRGELLVAAAVVALLAAVAVPTFAGQREKLAESQRVEANLELRRAVERYERFLANSGTSPKSGVYTVDKPIENLNGRPLVRPSPGVTITTKTAPDGGFTMEREKRTLAGTFVSSYDSATGSYKTPHSHDLHPAQPGLSTGPARLLVERHDLVPRPAGRHRTPS